MKKLKYLFLFFSCLHSVSTFSEISSAENKAPPNWGGGYIGATAGGVFSKFNTNIRTQAGTLLNSAQVIAINNAGNLKIKKNSFLAGIEGGYNWQFNHLFLGFETDIQSLSTNGEENSGALPYTNIVGRQFVITSYSNNNWLFNAKLQLGLITYSWLFYVTGGLGLTILQGDFVFSREFIFTNTIDSFESERVNFVKPGYVFGAGVEAALTQHLSLKAEYLFEKFNTTSASNQTGNVPSGQVFSSAVSLKSNIVKFGLNYHFNNLIMEKSLISLLNSKIFNINQWEFEVGGRFFISSGLDGAPQPLLNNVNSSNLLASRLVFSNLSAVSLDSFARLEHVKGFFVQGDLGAGSVVAGRLNDEDFPAGGSYSNTLSDVLGNLSYATVDFGYSFFKNLLGKMSFFIGYNYYAQNLNAYGCKQLAGSDVCVPMNLLGDFLGITEDDYFNSLRVGLSSQFNLTNRLMLLIETAYLPYVVFTGKDVHDARELIGPEHSNDGNGAMLNIILKYQLSDSWNIGLGARYWMWNMLHGDIIFDFLGIGDSIRVPGRFTTERYGVFLQLNYQYAKFTPAALFFAPVSWKGIFIGGNLGGGWGRSYWSDPFRSTIAVTGFTNVAGFGDELRSTGPLAGISLNVNWQTHRLVYGVGGSFSLADIRGENTLFSGIGGINGMTVTNYLGMIIGKLGVAFNRSLFYVNGGAAVLNTKFKLNGNTTILTLGIGSEVSNLWGWVCGIGVEHEIAKHWTSSVEYDYVGIPSHALSFPSVTTINTQRISARQGMNVFKLGLNFKLGS